MTNINYCSFIKEMIFPCLVHRHGLKYQNVLYKFYVTEFLLTMFWGGVSRFNRLHWKTGEPTIAHQPFNVSSQSRITSNI